MAHLSRNTGWILLAGLGVTILAGCCVLALVGAGGVLWFISDRTVSTIPPTFTAVARLTPTRQPTLTPPPTATPVAATATSDLPTLAPTAADTLKVLEAARVQPSNLRELSQQLRGIPDIPVTVSAQPADYAIGTELEFNAFNQDAQAAFAVKATLIYKTDNAYFFAESDLDVNPDSVKTLLDEFQSRIYPTDREFFGSEWTPGVDGDPRLFMLYARGLGFSLAGYYNSADEYSQLAHPDSNEKEMFYINADGTSITSRSLPGTLAHEFQHMIHWAYDVNEETWLNEGVAVLAELMNGYDPGSFDAVFIQDPDLQLNAWSEDSIPHYGAAFLFLAYVRDRFGEEFFKTLVADSANGLPSVDNALNRIGATEAATGRPLTAIDVFADWVVANYLHDPSVADGRYAYSRYTQAPQVEAVDPVYTCPANRSTTVHQFAADYYEIRCGRTVTLSFTGSQQVRVVPPQPHSGRYGVWSNQADESATALTREFDFTGLSRVTLDYWAWWQIEDGYDYGYVEVSTDDGQTWQIVRAPSSTDENSLGNSFGWAYTGASGGGETPEWVEENVDLSAYAGQKVWLRFQYVTDTALAKSGWMIDDLTIPEMNYRADFEADAGGWQADGFVRMDNLLPQTFVVQVIRRGADGQIRVERLPLDEVNHGILTLDLESAQSAVLVIAGTTPYTQETANYRFEIK